MFDRLSTIAKLKLHTTVFLINLCKNDNIQHCSCVRAFNFYTCLYIHVPYWVEGRCARGAKFLKHITHCLRLLTHVPRLDYALAHMCMCM